MIQLHTTSFSSFQQVNSYVPLCFYAPYVVKPMISMSPLIMIAMSTLIMISMSTLIKDMTQLFI